MTNQRLEKQLGQRHYRSIALAILSGILLVAMALIGSQYNPELLRSQVSARIGEPDPVFVDTDGGRVHIKTYGPSSGEPLLLIHGMSSSLYAWKDVAALIARHGRVIAIDLPFHSLTGPVDVTDCTSSSVAKFVWNVLDKLGIEKLSIAGSSWGGLIALRMTEAAPDRVNALVLLDSSGLPSPPSSVNRLARYAVGRLLLTDFLGDYIVRRSLGEAFYDRTKVTDDLVNQVVTLNRTAGNRQGQLLCRASLLAETQTPRPTWAGLKQPTLIIWGQDDPWIPVANAQAIARLLANARVQEYSHVGHLPMEERPDRVAADIVDFLKIGAK